MYLLDTNVISETMKVHMDPFVEMWTKSHEEESYICVISIEEMRYGQLIMPRGKRRDNLGRDIDNAIHRHADTILLYEESEAERCADFHALALQSGRTPALGDLMIAATASTHGMAVVTRNVKDFEYLPVRVINPFEERTDE